jgi:hypothetical protein
VRSDTEAEALALAFQQAGYQLVHVLENTANGLLATLRFAVPGGSSGPELDLLFASSGIEAEVVAEAEPIELLPGLLVPVAHLIAMKVLAESDARDQDRGDLLALIAAATEPDLEHARDAVRTIEQRGYSDHAPPHSHAIYGSDEAVIGIRPVRLIAGRLPKRVLGPVRTWARLHRDPARTPRRGSDSSIGWQAGATGGPQGNPPLSRSPWPNSERSCVAPRRALASVEVATTRRRCLTTCVAQLLLA